MDSRGIHLPGAEVGLGDSLKVLPDLDVFTWIWGFLDLVILFHYRILPGNQKVHPTHPAGS